MKKLWKQEKYRQYQSRRQWRETRKRYLANAQRRARPAAKSTVRRQPYTLTAPQVFSLVETPDETLKFLQVLRNMLPARQLRIDLKQVKKIDPEAVAAFVAVMESTGGSVAGNVPEDQNCTNRLNDFGFFECVTGGPRLGQPAGKIRLMHSGQQVEGAHARDIIMFGLKKLGDYASRKHGPAYTIFTEAMANTFQHADRRHAGQRPWWAGVYYDDTKQAACFTSVDVGVGILMSFSFRQRWMSWRSQFRLTNPDQGEKLRMLLSGEIPSRTGEKHRGRGLPNMKAACEEGRIQNLMILSNNAHAHVGRQAYRELKVGFRGAIVCWEVPSKVPQGE